MTARIREISGEATGVPENIGAPAREGCLLPPAFFNQEPQALARALLGKVLRHRVPTDSGPVWLAARIVETEAYYLFDLASHSSLGFTRARSAMFMAPGTIYMYHARGRDSLNFSARGTGNAVLVKAGLPWFDARSPRSCLALMRRRLGRPDRPEARLCAGQTLLCQALGLKVADWNRKTLVPHRFRLEEVGQAPSAILQRRRHGIRPERDAHRLYRFVDADHFRSSTSGRQGQARGS